jgi:hypothetical protein
VELVVVAEVVGVVVLVVFPTVLALFLDVSPAGPDVFPGVLALSDFGNHVRHLLCYHHLGSNHLIDSNRWRL